jgi:GT2 family glycosyltransferase
MSEPLVFIILVNWNGKTVTLDCLSSLSSISYSNCKIVIVDNGSTDDSVQAFRQAYPGVTVLEMGKNLRYSGGANAGMKYALNQGAELILQLNNDTTVDKGFLSHLVDTIQSDPSIGMVAPKIYYHDEPTRIWFAGVALSMWTGTMRHIGIREYDKGQYDTPREIPQACGCCLIAPRSVVEQIGLLDESYFLYSEDADWIMRARRAGYRIMYEPRSKVWHKISVDSGGHLSWYKNKNKFISNFRFFSRYASWYHWLVFPWLNIVVNGWSAVKYLLFHKIKTT